MILTAGIIDSRRGAPPPPPFSPEQIANCTFYADMLDTNTFRYSSGSVVEQLVNKVSVGITLPENVTNGTFDANITGWTVQSSTVVWDASNGGCMKVTNTAASQGFGRYVLTTLAAGKIYRVKATAISGTSTQCNVLVRDNIGAVTIITKTVNASSGSFDFTFMCPANNTNIDLRLMNNNVNGAYLFWDNVSVVQADAEIQLTVANQGTLQAAGINGKASLQFDGATTYYANGKVLAADFTKFATIKHDFTSTNSCNIISAQTTVDHSLVIARFSATVDRFSLQQGNLTFDITNLDAQNQFTIVETFSTSTGQKALWVNGMKVATGSTAKTVADFSYYLGAYGSLAATTFYKGQIADHGTFSRVLTDTEIGQIDDHQRKRWRVPTDNFNYVAIAAIGQSNSVGLAQAQSDPIASGSGFNFIPSINHFHDVNDKAGEGYSLASIGSSHPPFASKFSQLSGKKIALTSNGKTATSISQVASSNPSDRTLDWGTGSTLRSNFIAWTNKMLASFNKTALDWVIINQGERDVTYMVGDATWTKDTYKAAFLDLMNYCKTNYPGVKILIIQTVQEHNTSGDAPKNTAQWQQVITAQQELASQQANTFIIQDTSTFTITNGNIEGVDGIHYTKAGNVIVGQSAATKINQNL